MTNKRFLLPAILLSGVFSLSSLLPSVPTANAEVVLREEAVAEVYPSILSDFDCFVTTIGAPEITFKAPLFSACASYMNPDYEYTLDAHAPEDIPGFSSSISSSFAVLAYNENLPTPYKVAEQELTTDFYLWVDGEYARADEFMFGISAENKYISWSNINQTLGEVWFALGGGDSGELAYLQATMTYFDGWQQERVTFNANTTVTIPSMPNGIQPFQYNQTTRDFLERMRSVWTNQDGYVFVDEFRLSIFVQAPDSEYDRWGYFQLREMPSYLVERSSYFPEYNPTVIVETAPAPTDVLLSPVKAFLTTEVFDGFTFGNLLTVMLGLALFGWFLRSFAGG